MIHTIEIFKYINKKNYKQLNSMKKCFKIKDNVISFDLDLSSMENVGINKIKLSKVKDANIYSLKIELNLSKLCGGQNLSLFTPDKSYSHLKKNFQYYMFQVLDKNIGEKCFEDLELFTDFETFYVSRIDCAVQTKVEDVQTYIELLQNGDIPHKNGAKYKLHHKLGKDNKEPKEGSIYYTSNRYNINFYDKTSELKNHNAQENIISQAQGLLRLEVQCLSPALNYQRMAITNKKNKDNWEALIDWKNFTTRKFSFFNNPEFSRKMIEDKFLEIAQKGTYYKRSIGLVKIKDAKNIYSCSKKKLLEIYNFVNPLGHKRRSIRELREKIRNGTYKGTIKDELELTGQLKKFDTIGVNAVALKENYKFSSLPNLCNVIADGTTDYFYY